MTLNEAKYILKRWFNNHAMINTVIYSDDFDFNAERNILYPVANIEFLNSSISNKQQNYNFKVVIADVSKPDDTEQEDNIHSDALQVAEGLFAYLQTTEGFFFNQSSSLNKFTDDTADRTAGIVFTFTMNSIRPINTCWVPVKN